MRFNNDNLAIRLKDTVSSEQEQVRNLLLKIYQLENENKVDYR